MLCNITLFDWRILIVTSAIKHIRKCASICSSNLTFIGLGYHIKNYQNSRETYVENDCYKKYPVTTFYVGDYPVYTPLIREDIENKILSFRNEIYIARSDCFYRKIGQNSDFEIENGFIYQKESGASFFYDSFRGTLLNITGLLDWPFEKQQIEQNKTKIKSINK